MRNFNHKPIDDLAQNFNPIQVNTQGCIQELPGNSHLWIRAFSKESKKWWWQAQEEDERLSLQPYRSTRRISQWSRIQTLSEYESHQSHINPNSCLWCSTRRKWIERLWGTQITSYEVLGWRWWRNHTLPDQRAYLRSFVETDILKILETQNPNSTL